MSIKNWTVTTERVKGKSDGLSEYASYLVSSKHKNHKNTEIYNLYNSDANKFLNNTIVETLNFDSENKKGGRKVESYAQSFNFILPPPHKPTKEQWQDIGFELLKTVHSELDIKGDFTKFVRSCFVNIHDQANPHLNMLIPRIYDGERLSDLDRKNVLAKLKQQFNTSVLKHCNIDHTHHNPLRVNTGRRKNAQHYAYDQAKEKAETALKLISEAHSATVGADVAQKDAEVKIKTAENKIKALEVESIEIELKKSKLNFFIRAFKEFRINLTNWVESIRKESPLDTIVNRQKLEKTANRIVESKAVDDENAELVVNLIDEQAEKLEKDNYKVSKPEVRRRVKPKAG